MNPKADGLKRRTFAFALDMIRFCRTLRETWEGRELSDQVYWLELIQASGVCTTTALPQLLREAGELCAIFTQSHITARANANLRPAQSPQSPNKLVNS